MVLPGRFLYFGRKIMKKTELVQFKEEYESAVRNVDEIINNPYTAILLKYKKAEESNYCIKFRQYALRYWGQLHGVDFSEFGDEQRVRPTEGTEVVPAWDYDFSGANEVHQSDDFEPLESVALFIPEGKSKTREKFKKKRDKARHKLDVSVSPETASDYLCADGIITKQELVERRKGLDEQIAELQTQYESVEQEDERSGALDMNLISQKLDEWQRASENDVNRELINSCVAQITPMTNEEFRWVLDFQLSELQGRNTAAYTMDGFIEMARFSISFEEAKAFKASRNQGIRKNEWHDLTVVVGIQSKIQR
jgi:hypothetical protein